MKTRIVKHVACGCIIALVCGLAPLLGAAQPGDSGSSLKHVLSRLTISFEGFHSGGGPAGDIEAVMRRAGLDASLAPCFFGICLGDDPIEHPHSSNESVGLRISVAYHWSEALTIAASYSNIDQGETSGLGTHFRSLRLDYSLRAFEPMVFVGPRAQKPPRLIAVGIGPGIYRATMSRDCSDLGGCVEHKTATRLGFSLAATLRVPRRRIFTEIRFAYRVVGKMKHGPYETSFMENVTVIPESTAAFHSWQIGAGLGMRLGS